MLALLRSRRSNILTTSFFPAKQDLESSSCLLLSSLSLPKIGFCFLGCFLMSHFSSPILECECAFSLMLWFALLFVVHLVCSRHFFLTGCDFTPCGKPFASGGWGQRLLWSWGRFNPFQLGPYQTISAKYSFSASYYQRNKSCNSYNGCNCTFYVQFACGRL